jgi:hypothetical protein
MAAGSDNSTPVGPHELLLGFFSQTADGLARDLKRGWTLDYVEYHELVEVLIDGTTRSCWPLLALPESN